MFAQCLHSVLEHTPPDVRVLVADDASEDPAIGRLVEQVNAVRPPRSAVVYLRQPQNVGFVHNVNEALRLLAPADVIVLNSDCVVTEGWYEGLRRAAYSDTRVATASALTNHGSIVSIPERNRPLPNIPQEWSLEAAAAAIRAESTNTTPTLPAAIGHCLYIRRSALELVGAFDEAFAPGYEEEVDFSQRCIRHGLSHVLADDVFVLHYGWGSFKNSESVDALRTEHHGLITARYSYYDAWVEEVAQRLRHAAGAVARRRPARAARDVADGRRPHPDALPDRHPAAHPGDHRRAARARGDADPRDRPARPGGLREGRARGPRRASAWSARSRRRPSRPRISSTAPTRCPPTRTCSCCSVPGSASSSPSRT